MYVDIGEGATDKATIKFAFDSATDNTRQWEVKVSQIDCAMKDFT